LTIVESSHLSQPFHLSICNSVYLFMYNDLCTKCGTKLKELRMGTAFAARWLYEKASLREKVSCGGQRRWPRQRGPCASLC